MKYNFQVQKSISQISWTLSFEKQYFNTQKLFQIIHLKPIKL